MSRRTSHGLLLAAVAVACVSVVSCDTPEERHRVLTFFFDGVPPLYAPDTGDVAADAGAPEARRGKARPKPQRTQTVWYKHKPATDKKQCVNCHDTRRGFALLAPKSALCITCHNHEKETRKYEWMHGPVAIGACAACHEPHKSPYPHLVSALGSKLCFRCHERTPKGGKTRGCKRVQDQVRCTRCHNPHGGRDRFFLMASLAKAGPGAPAPNTAKDADRKKNRENSLKPDEQPKSHTAPVRQETR